MVHGNGPPTSVACEFNAGQTTSYVVREFKPDKAYSDPDDTNNCSFGFVTTHEALGAVMSADFAAFMNIGPDRMQDDQTHLQEVERCREVRRREEIVQITLLRDVFTFSSNDEVQVPDDNPQRGEIRDLAQHAYEDRILPSGHLDHAKLRLLAEMLARSGNDARNQMIGHLRDYEIHVRGCWVIDLILDKL